MIKHISVSSIGGVRTTHVNEVRIAEKTFVLTYDTAPTGVLSKIPSSLQDIDNIMQSIETAQILRAMKYDIREGLVAGDLYLVSSRPQRTNAKAEAIVFCYPLTNDIAAKVRETLEELL